MLKELSQELRIKILTVETATKLSETQKYRNRSKHLNKALIAQQIQKEAGADKLSWGRLKRIAIAEFWKLVSLTVSKVHFARI